MFKWKQKIKNTNEKALKLTKCLHFKRYTSIAFARFSCLIVYVLCCVVFVCYFVVVASLMLILTRAFIQEDEYKISLYSTNIIVISLTDSIAHSF